jgi:plastocyanin
LHTHAAIFVKRSTRRGANKAIVGAIAILAVAVAAAVIIMIGSNTGPPSAAACGSSGSTAVQVSIYSGAGDSSKPPGYLPDNITLVIGVNNTVTWTNNDSVHHTVTTTSAPSGAGFNSGNMNSGVSCTHTFSTPGTYEYDCVYHSWMTGTIVVKAAS